MRNKVKFFILMVVIILGCSACNGNVTRDIRHAGFSLSGDEFICEPLFPDDDEDTDYEKIKYLNSSFVITNSGNIYELSMGQKFSNDKNCKKANYDLGITAIFDDKIVKAENGKYYYIVSENNVAAYSEVTVNDNGYEIYNLLLTDSTILKVMTVDQSNGVYYVLKNDGNVYKYVVTRTSSQEAYSIVSTAIIYNKNDFGGAIIDFNEAGENPNTYIRTNNAIYRMQATNKEKCTKYADIVCKYKLKKDTTLTEYKDRLLGYNGSLLITDYGRVFSVSA